MKVIAVTNRKGGVGKSTIASHLAAGLAVKGYKVGFVDTDSQGHASMMIGIAAEDGLHNLLVNKSALEDVVIPVPHENFAPVPTTGSLYLIPSSDKTYKIPLELKEHETFLFLERMEEFAETYNLDIIIVDTNPSLSLFDGSIYLAVDGFLYITECEMLSMSGIQSAIDQMESFQSMRRKYLNRESKMLGIVPNKFRSKTIIHRENVKKLGSHFGKQVWSPVILRTLWTEASNLHQPVFMYEPESDAANEAWELVERLEQEVNQWLQTENA